MGTGTILLTECYMVLVLLVGSFAVVNVNFVAIYAWFINVSLLFCSSQIQNGYKYGLITGIMTQGLSGDNVLQKPVFVDKTSVNFLTSMKLF